MLLEINLLDGEFFNSQVTTTKLREDALLKV